MKLQNAQENDHYNKCTCTQILSYALRIPWNLLKPLRVQCALTQTHSNLTQTPYSSKHHIKTLLAPNTKIHSKTTHKPQDVSFHNDVNINPKLHINQLANHVVTIATTIIKTKDVWDNTYLMEGQ